MSYNTTTSLARAAHSFSTQIKGNNHIETRWPITERRGHHTVRIRTRINFHHIHRATATLWYHKQLPFSITSQKKPITCETVHVGSKHTLLHERHHYKITKRVHTPSLSSKNKTFNPSITPNNKGTNRKGSFTKKNTYTRRNQTQNHLQ